MIIIREKKSANILDKPVESIAQEFKLISITLNRLELIFLDKNWAIKESYEDSINLYSGIREELEKHFRNIDASISWLRNLSLGPPPLRFNKASLREIERWALKVHNQIASYSRKTKDKNMPQFNEEIERLGGAIKAINVVLSEINKANKPHGVSPYPSIRNPFA